MVDICFIRGNNRRIKRGYIADSPLNQDVSFVEPFIIVSVDETTVPKGLTNSVHLDLDKLMLKYPNTIELFDDEEGKQIEKAVYGYFHELSRSCKPYPIITMEDVYE